MCDIPKMVLETPNLSISIIGIDCSGKTCYLTTLLNEISKAQKLGITLLSQNKDTHDHQNSNMQILNSGRICNSTATGSPTPQMWGIKKRNSKRSVLSYTINIYDNAGEDCIQTFSSDSCPKNIYASKAMILTIDPLMLTSIRKDNIVDANLLRNSIAGNKERNENPVDVINTVSMLIRTMSGYEVNSLLKIPVAVVITKIDTLLSTIKSDILRQDSSLCTSEGKVNIMEMQQVDTEIRNWLNSIGEVSLIDALEMNFLNHQFFGVSSFGKPPTSASTIDTMRPHRVLDPILWLFKKANILE
jgi:hypothetical protein